MKILYLTSIFCICAAFNLSAAENISAGAADPCANFDYDIRLNLTSSYGQLRYNTNLDRQALTELGRSYGLVEEGMSASGLSLIGVDWSVSLDTVARAAADDSVCIFPTGLDVFIGFREPEIYIDNTLPQNSCRYRQVLRHEHQHLQISVAALEYFLPRIRRQIEKQLTSVRPRRVESLSASDATTADMNEAYVALIRPLVDEFKATLLYEQKKLDNPENYRYESAICRNHP